MKRFAAFTVCVLLLVSSLCGADLPKPLVTGMTNPESVCLGIDGGLPIVHEGKIIGAIGASGVKSTEDSQVAAADLEALKPETKSQPKPSLAECLFFGA